MGSEDSRGRVPLESARVSEPWSPFTSRPLSGPLGELGLQGTGGLGGLGSNTCLRGCGSQVRWQGRGGLAFSFPRRPGLEAPVSYGPETENSSPGPELLKNLAQGDPSRDRENAKGPWERTRRPLPSKGSQMFPVWPLKVP